MHFFDYQDIIFLVTCLKGDRLKVPYSKLHFFLFFEHSIIYFLQVDYKQGKI